MKPIKKSLTSELLRAAVQSRMRRWRVTLTALFAIPLIAISMSAHASFLSGDTLDAVADVMAWVVLIIAPIVAIGVFLMVHILPEKVAEHRNHPQLSAIKTLCILSLFFGGMLWPIAWLWAYSKPVFHKLAYGTDVAESETKPVLAEAAEPRIVDSKLLRAQVNERGRRAEEG